MRMFSKQVIQFYYLELNMVRKGTSLGNYGWSNNRLFLVNVTTRVAELSVLLTLDVLFVKHGTANKPNSDEI